MIAFYYGLTGFACGWYYRATLSQNARTLWLRGILPVAGGIILWAALGYNLYYYWNPANSFTSWTMQFPPHWHIGGVFIIDIISLVLGLVLMYTYAAIRPAFFKGEVLNRDTPTMVPEDLGVEVGLFGIDESQTETH